MRFKLTIDCTTIAFGDNPELHLADVLRGIANTIQHIGTEIGDRPQVYTPVCDVNGIRCGTWVLTKNERAAKASSTASGGVG